MSSYPVPPRSDQRRITRPSGAAHRGPAAGHRTRPVSPAMSTSPHQLAYARGARRRRPWPHRGHRCRGGAAPARRGGGVDQRRHCRHSRRSISATLACRRGAQALSPAGAGTGRVRYVGDPVAAVFADDPYVAEDAADLVESRSRRCRRSCPRATRPANSTPAAAPRPRLCATATATSTPRSRAAHTVIELDLSIGRHSGVPLETRGAHRPSTTPRTTCWSCTAPPRCRTATARRWCRMLGPQRRRDPPA